MVYQSQRIAYAYFLAAVLLFGLQVAFGFVSLAKYLGPDPLLNVVNFATAKTIHTNLLLVWILTGFMDAAYYIVPDSAGGIPDGDLQRVPGLRPDAAEDPGPLPHVAGHGRDLCRGGHRVSVGFHACRSTPGVGPAGLT